MIVLINPQTIQTRGIVARTSHDNAPLSAKKRVLEVGFKSESALKVLNLSKKNKLSHKLSLYKIDVRPTQKKTPDHVSE